MAGPARIQLNPELTEIRLTPETWELQLQPQITSVEYRADQIVLQLGGALPSAGDVYSVDGLTGVVVLPLATTSTAGKMSASDKTKLDDIATGATANQSDAYLLARANHTGTQPWNTITGTPSTLAGYGITDAIPTSQKAAANGVASLGSDGKIPSNQIPAIAITETYAVNTQAAMLAIDAQVGDVAVRMDVSKSFILAATPASVLANWQELITPTGAVVSVNGQIGTVNLTTGNISEAGANLWYTDARARAAISAYSPLAYNSALGTLAIQSAGSSQSGYLTQTDWLSFNNRLAPANNLSDVGSVAAARANLGLGSLATVTPTGTPDGTKFLRDDGSWQAVVGGISLSSLSASSPLVYNNGTGAFSIQQANGSQAGYLSSADWTTFNSKQAALGYTPLNPASNLSDVANTTTARSNLGLVIGTNIQAQSARLQEIVDGFAGASNGQVVRKKADGTGIEYASVSASPGGSNTQVQYNNSGSFGGSSNLAFDGTVLTASGINVTNTLQLITKQDQIQYREITRSGGNITRISIYTNSSKVTELYRKTFSYTGSDLTSITEVDYTRSPNVTRTKTFTRSSGEIVNIEVA